MAKTLDEQLTDLEDDIRKLKIEFDIFFNNGAGKRPPYDTKNRVEAVIKRLSDDRSMRFAHRFRFNQIVSRFTAFRQMWMRAVQEREEGRDMRAQYLAQFRGSEDVRRAELAEAFDFDMDSALDAIHAPPPMPKRFTPTSVELSDPARQEDSIRRLYESVAAAKRTVGDATETTSYEKFRQMIIYNADRIRAERNKTEVQFSVDIEDGKVKFKAR